MSDKTPSPIPSLRPSQQAVVNYDGGKLGVAAVPGAGKTHTLSHLAASLIETLIASNAADEQEVLIVTLTNSAVNSFRSRIARLVQQERGLLPYIGYRVRTLHSLANDIVRERPDLAGLTENFDILDERVTGSIIREIAENVIRSRGDVLLEYFDNLRFDGPDAMRNILRRNGSSLVESLAYTVIRLAKDNRWDPEDMGDLVQSAARYAPLAELGVSIYTDYQRALAYRGAADFDDLVRLAMQALESDRDFLHRMQERWPYILEDEAQDSSKLQNELLRTLAGERNPEFNLSAKPINWVRVGDTNQSIYTTFTTADSNYLRLFLLEEDTREEHMPVSGRSSQAIIDIANYMVRWASSDPLIQPLHDTFYPLSIQPTSLGDPQQNPQESFVYIDAETGEDISPDREIARIIGSIEKWLPDHPDWTCAVLVPENSRGFKVSEALKERGIPYEELLRSTTKTRDAADRLQAVISFCSDPSDGRRLAHLHERVYWQITQAGRDDDDAAQLMREQLTRALRQLKTTEDYLWPGMEGDWLESLTEIGDEWREHLARMRDRARVWLQAAALPVDQLILTIGQELFFDQVDLALTHRIAVVMAGIANNNPDYRLPELSAELHAIAQNERRFLGMDDATDGYDPKPGLVTVSTMHAAKGLEWDRVYLMAVNNYSFPAVQPGDSYYDEKWYLRDDLNLQAELQAQFEHLEAGEFEAYQEGDASQAARAAFAAERLRLLYVGITRARQDLVMTWNMGRFYDRGTRNQPSAAMFAIHQYWKDRSNND